MRMMTCLEVKDLRIIYVQEELAADWGHTSSYKVMFSREHLNKSFPQDNQTESNEGKR